jgi:flagellar biogenesis protein FliO
MDFAPTEVLLGLLPILLMIGVLYWFLRRLTGPNSYQSRCLAAMQRQNEMLERIAAAIEKRQ